MVELEIIRTKTGQLEIPFLILPVGYEVEEKISDEEVQLKVKKSEFQKAMDTFSKAYSLPDEEAEKLALKIIQEHRAMAEEI